MAKRSATIDGALLDAGAVLPAAAAPAGDDTIDMLTARTYRHPVLDGPIVALVPGTLGAADDLTMEFLGFEAPDSVVDVGLVRQQALGFPAWALVHDPANGHHALALVKDIERLTRMAKSRVGPAKDGFDALGEQLSRSVPHFLPTFYEEAARAFLAADSPTYAASMFGKARDAERSYALRMDEERQHTVFLEFALEGALTAKALSAHARDLALRSSPEVAYERFRRLCVERTLGGLPPYAAMHIDLRRLATKAKVDEAADEQFLAQLLAAPSIIRAPGSFWIAYRPVLARLAKRHPEVSGRLLAMLPTECTDEVWLDILQETGAIRALTDPADSIPAGAESPDGPAGWLVRFDDRREGYRRTRLPALLALVERMADRLRSDAVAVALCRNHDYVDFDVVDLCLSLDIPLAEVPPGANYHVQQWLKDKTEGRRDLTYLAAHERLRAGLADSIESYLQPGWQNKSKVDVEKVAEVVAVPGLRTATAYWLDALADRVTDRGLPTLGSELDRVTLLACPDGLAVNPAALGRILDHRLGPVLGRTLRAGVFDEYGWPAFETAVAALGADATTDDEDKFQFVTQWPHLLVRFGDQVVVVDGDEVAAEHLVRIPADQRSYMWRTALRYVDGQLLVSWDIGRERAGYWTGTPDDVFITADDAFSFGSASSLALTGGGRSAGGRPLQIGDRSAHERGRVASDGTTYWVRTDNWYEYDVRTGALGRASLPAFFEDGAVDGARLDAEFCTLLPAMSEPAGSPLGSRDGLIGWRIRETRDGSRTGEGIDGRSFTLPAALRVKKSGLHGQVLGAFRFPGSDTTYGMIWTTGYRDNNVTLCTSDGFVIGRYKYASKRGKYAKGTPMLPPPGYWHYLRPRDLAGSAALRTVSDETAGELLADAAGLDHDGVTLLVRRLLPAVTDAALVDGVAGVVRRAAKHAARLAEFARVAAGEVVADREKKVRVERPEDGRLPKDGVLAAALSGFLPYCYDRGRSAVRLLAQAGAVLTGDGAGDAADLLKTVNEADDDWFQALSALPAAMIRAVSPVTRADHRDALLGLLEVSAASGLLTPGGRLRQLWLEADGPAPVRVAGEVLANGAGRTFVMHVDSDDQDMKVLDYAPDGAFAAVPGYRITREIVFDTFGATPELIAAFVPLARERGPVPWSADLAEAASRTVGMSIAEVATLLAGLPEQRVWDEQPVEWLETLPVKADAVKVALSSWGNRPRIDRLGSFAALLPADVATLWTDGPGVDGLASWWASRYGIRNAVPDDLIVAAQKAGIAEGMSASELIHGLANADTCRWLAGPVDGIDADDLLVSVVRALPWLVYRLPSDDPIRAGLHGVLERCRRRLDDADLLVDVGYLDEKKIGAFTNALGVPVVSDERGIDAGPVFFPPDSGWRKTQLRPSRLSGADDPVLGMLSTRLENTHEGPIAAIRVLLGDQLSEWVNYKVLADAAGAEHDPSRSLPALVAEIAEARGLSADAATIYLQLLALPDPTDRNIAAWTGWKPARLKAARAELAATDLVVDAKRARAGRTLFLPGGWLALRAPHLPLERWKLPLLVGGAAAIDGLGMVIPAAPVPRLFELAWTRVLHGDAPRFDDLVTGRQR